MNGMLERPEQAFETQRQFIDDVGHELRTPLTIVQGHLEQLDDDPRQRAESVRLVLDEVERMGRLVGDLLVLARSERPDFLDWGTADLAELTEGMYAKVRALADRRWVLDGVGEGSIVVDQQRLTQAVMQLAANAVRHTEAGDVIAIGSAMDDRGMRIWVRDTGSGIDPEERDRIFERFRQGARSIVGSGLGLSIVRAIATAHGGRVELRSRPGGGAAFTLVLPVDGRAAEAAEVAL